MIISKSTFIKLFLFTNCTSPITPKNIHTKIGTSPNQSVMTYKGIYTPVRLWIKPLSVAKPTLDFFGPIACTSIKRIANVHTANDTSHATAMQSRTLFFLFFIVKTCLYVIFFDYNAKAQSLASRKKKRAVTTTTRFVALPFYPQKHFHC